MIHIEENVDAKSVVVFTNVLRNDFKFKTSSHPAFAITYERLDTVGSLPVHAILVAAVSFGKSPNDGMVRLSLRVTYLTHTVDTTLDRQFKHLCVKYNLLLQDDEASKWYKANRNSYNLIIPILTAFYKIVSTYKANLNRKPSGGRRV